MSDIENDEQEDELVEYTVTENFEIDTDDDVPEMDEDDD
jgi:hypothetical protein